MNLRRKRLRLMRDTQWRGYARTAEGNPITLSQVRSIVALSVFGNSSQDGTPSPDNPLDVIGTGERTGNLFDISQVGDTNTLYYDGEKLKVTAYSNSTNLSVEKFLAMTGLRPGDVFTAARQYEVINGTANSATGSIRFNKKDGSGQFLIIPGNKDVAINVVPDDFNSDIYSAINFYGTNSGDLKEVIFSNIQILKGEYTAETIPAYEPYGYKVAVTASGRNLFNKGKAWAEYETIEGAVYYTTKILKLKPNTAYYCKSFAPVETDTIAFLSRNKEVNASLSVTIALTVSGQGRGYEKQITTSDDGNLYIGTSKTANIDDILQNSKLYIIEGVYTTETLPPYEPYKEPQSFNVYSPDVLHGVGDAHDTVILDFDRRKAQLIKQYEYFKVDADKWSQSGDSYNGEITTDRYHNYNKYSGHLSMDDSKCNILPKYNGAIWASDVQGFTFNTVQLHLRINNDVLGVTANDTTEERTSKFAEYIQSNDIYVLGKLISPVVRDITALQNWDALPQLRGTWILTATGGTEPTLTAEYYSNERSTE